MKAISVLCLIVTFQIQLSCQTQFVKTLETNLNRYCRASSLDSNDNIFMACYNEDSLNGELIKVNKFGMLEWAMRISPQSLAGIGDLCVATNNNQILVGGWYDTAHVYSFDQNGQLLWCRNYYVPNTTSGRLLKIVPVLNTFYLLCAAYDGTNEVAYLTKIDQQGNVISTTSYPVSGASDMIYHASSNEMLITTIDVAGTALIWTDTAGTFARSYFYSNVIMTTFACLNDTSVVAVGELTTTGLPIIVCISNDGIPLWSEQLQDTSYYITRLVSIVVASDNYIYVGTGAFQAAIQPPAALIKLSPTGNVVWAKGFFNYTTLECSIWGVHEQSDHSLFLTGSHEAIGQDIYVMREDTSNSLSCISFSFSTAALNYPVSYATTNFATTSVTTQSTIQIPIITPYYCNQIFDCATTVEDISTQTHFTVYPNPSSGEIYVTGVFPEGTGMNIYNILGQRVCAPIPISEGNFNIPIKLDLACGTYFFRLEAFGELYEKGKLIVK